MMRHGADPGVFHLAHRWLLVLAAAAACLLPARRVTQVNPMAVLRGEWRRPQYL
jgi:hypothetical protein